jgi:P-type Mg2+ transporter
LLRCVTTKDHVLRQTADIEIDRKDVVSGDILFTSTLIIIPSSLITPSKFALVLGGNIFLGDCVILSAEAVTVFQASLTGELMPVDKGVRLDLPPPQYTFDLLRLAVTHIWMQIQGYHPSFNFSWYLPIELRPT